MAKEGFTIEVNHNEQLITEVVKNLANEKEIAAAVNRSLKRTMKGLYTYSIKSLRERKILKITRDKWGKAVRTYYTGGASTPASQQNAKLWFTTTGQPLGRFYARRVRAGKSNAVMKQDKYGAWRGVQLYSVKVNAYGAPYLKDPKRTFLVPKGSGPIVFKRLGQKRLPVEKQLGPGLSDILRSTGLATAFEAYARERYEREIINNVKFYAERAVQRAMAKSK